MMVVRVTIKQECLDLNKQIDPKVLYISQVGRLLPIPP